MQKLQLSIPEPCHENWYHMTPTDQGRFCNACAKEVVDFSMMTDTEVLNYFTSLTHDKVCGRALPSQLERTISKPKEPKKKLFWYWNYVLMFFMFFTKGNGAKAQGAIKPVTHMNPVKANDVRGEMAVANAGSNPESRVITGKVTDKAGNPVSYPTIKIKGTNNGVAADAHGKYSIRIKTGTVLEISGVSYKTVEVPVGTRSLVDIVMEDAANTFLAGDVVITGYTPNSESINSKSQVALLSIKDDEHNTPVPGAVILIVKEGINKTEPVFADSKGEYKIKGIRSADICHIKVQANGYESNEFTIDGSHFKDRKKTWEVLLRKQKIKETKPVTVRPATGRTMALGGMVVLDKSKEPIYVIDGLIKFSANNIKPEDIEEISILKGAEATAIYGTQASNGAIVITSRKAKEIKLQEVIVNSDFCTKSVTLGGIGYTNTYEGSFLGDTIATVKTLLTNSIKVYPNPVQRNTGFSVALQLKQAGNYRIQVTDASGSILLLQKFNATSKNHTEKIMSDGRWAGGIYDIRVSDAQNKLISKSSFIVQ